MAYGEINTHAKNEILRDKVNSRCINESGNNHYGDKFIKIYISLLEKYNTDLQIIKPGYDHKAGMGSAPKITYEQESILYKTIPKALVDNIDMLENTPDVEGKETNLELHNEPHTQPGRDNEAEFKYLRDHAIAIGYRHFVVNGWTFDTAKLQPTQTMLKTISKIIKHYNHAIVTGKQIGRASCRERVLRLV